MDGGGRPLASGIFSGIQGQDPEPYGLLHIDLESFSNYPGIYTDEVAIEEFDAHIAAGHLFATYSIDEVREHLGGEEPVLNKIGIITKMRAGTIKKRITRDTLLS